MSYCVTQISFYSHSTNNVWEGNPLHFSFSSIVSGQYVFSSKFWWNYNSIIFVNMLANPIPLGWPHGTNLSSYYNIEFSKLIIGGYEVQNIHHEYFITELSYNIPSGILAFLSLCPVPVKLPFWNTFQYNIPSHPYRKLNSRDKIILMHAQVEGGQKGGDEDSTAYHLGCLGTDIKWELYSLLQTCISIIEASYSSVRTCNMMANKSSNLSGRVLLNFVSTMFF